MSDDRYDERPDRPAWAVVPTMPWSRVQPAERRDTGTAPTGPRTREQERREQERRELERQEQERRERERPDRRDPDRRDTDRREPDRRDADRREPDRRDPDRRDQDRRDQERREYDRREGPRDGDPYDDREQREDRGRPYREDRERAYREDRERAYREDRDRAYREQDERERGERDPADYHREPRPDRSRREPDHADYREADYRDRGYREPEYREPEPDYRRERGYRDDRYRDETERAYREERRGQEYGRSPYPTRPGYDPRDPYARPDDEPVQVEEEYRPRRAAAEVDAIEVTWVPTDAVAPTSSIPASAIPASAIPASAIPASAIPASGAPAVDTGFEATVPAFPIEPVYMTETGAHPESYEAEATQAAAFQPEAPTYQAEAIADPESALAAVRIDYDPQTLHETPENVYELYRIRDSLTTRIDAANDNPSRARLLGLRAVVGRIVGDLRQSLADAKLALVHAEATGQLRRIAVAQSRLANTLVRLGELDEADRLFTQANSTELPERLRATIHHYAGKCAFEQDRYIEACQHFEKALELRRDGDPELVAATEVALDALFSRVAERGWGPYPRSRDEILLSPQVAGADLRRAVRPLGLRRRRRQLADRPAVRRRPAVPRRGGLGPAGRDRDVGPHRRGRPAAHRSAPRLPRRRELRRRSGLGVPGRAGRLVGRSTSPAGSSSTAASTTYARSAAASRSSGSGANGARSRATAGWRCSSRSTRSRPAWPTAATSTASPTRGSPSSRSAGARASSTGPAG